MFETCGLNIGREDIKELFPIIDADSSGEIDQEEGKSFLLSQGVPAKQAEELWRRLLEAADTDGDGRLTKEEWTTGLQVPTVLALAVMLDESLNQAGSVRHRLGRLFDRIDTDRSGFIEEREAKSWADLAALFQDGDADDLSPKLLTMDPDDAALVLRQLQPDRVSELLNQLNPEKYQLYVDAYRRAGLDDEEE